MIEPWLAAHQSRRSLSVPASRILCGRQRFHPGTPRFQQIHRTERHLGQGNEEKLINQEVVHTPSWKYRQQTPTAGNKADRNTVVTAPAGVYEQRIVTMNKRCLLALERTKEASLASVTDSPRHKTRISTLSSTVSTSGIPAGFI